MGRVSESDDDDKGGYGSGRDKDTGAGSGQSAAQGRGGQADVGGQSSPTGDSADNGERERDNGLTIGKMPDHIAELSPTFDRSFTEEDKTKAIDDYNNANGFQAALSAFAGAVGLANPLAGMAGSYAADAYGTRAQQPGESYAAYQGRLDAANSGLSGVGGFIASAAGGLLGAPGKAVEIGKLGLDTYSRVSPVSGGTPSQPSGLRDRDSDTSQTIASTPANNYSAAVSAKPTPQPWIEPEIEQEEKQPFAIGRLNQQRYGLLSNLS